MTGFQIGCSPRERRERLLALGGRAVAYAAVALWSAAGWGWGWGAVIPWAVVAVLDAVVSVNRVFAMVLADDEGMELRTFFNQQYIRWDTVCGIAVEPNRGGSRRVLRVYRTSGYPVDVPGATSPALPASDGDRLHPGSPSRYPSPDAIELDSKAAVLREHWRRVTGQPL